MCEGMEWKMGLASQSASNGCLVQTLLELGLEIFFLDYLLLYVGNKLVPIIIYKDGAT